MSLQSLRRASEATSLSSVLWTEPSTSHRIQPTSQRTELPICERCCMINDLLSKPTSRTQQSPLGERQTEPSHEPTEPMLTIIRSLQSPLSSRNNLQEPLGSKFRSKFQFRAIFRDFWSRSRRNDFLDFAFFLTFFLIKETKMWQSYHKLLNINDIW
jgi:hypothetical protein